MRLTVSKVPAEGILITRWRRGACVGRAYLYLMRNKLHDEPFGFMEDVFVDESCRGKGVGEALVKRVIAEAKKRGCYKLVATSRHERPRVHDLYLKLGFKERGKEFRVDFEKTP